LIDEFNLCAGEVWCSWEDVEELEVLANLAGLGDGCLTKENIIDRLADVLDAHTASGITLGIPIYEERALLRYGQ